MSKLTPGYATVGKINLQKEILNLTMREGSKLLNYVRFCQNLKRLADVICFYNSIIYAISLLGSRSTFGAL